MAHKEKICMGQAEFFTRKNSPVSPSELKMGLGRSKRSDL